MSEDAPLASTVLILRPHTTTPQAGGSDGVEVFLVQRHRNSGFLPHAWVFPGGRVDPGDRLAGHPRVRGGRRALAALDLGDELGTAALVAGVRETFEEAGIWLGEGTLPEDAREPLARGEVSLAALLEAQGAAIDLDKLVPWSWWITPVSEPRRFDTRFFVTVANGEGHHDEHETVDSGWFTPEAVLEGADVGRFPMAPPTWWTLKEIAGGATPEAVATGGWSRPQRPIQPILHLGESGFELFLPGHPRHPEPAIPGLPARILFRQGRWWRADEA